MEKFVYGVDELLIGDTQCELCIYFDANEKYRCEKYENKPLNVLKGEVKCPHIRTSIFQDMFDDLLSSDSQK